MSYLLENSTFLFPTIGRDIACYTYDVLSFGIGYVSDIFLLSIEKYFAYLFHISNLYIHTGFSSGAFVIMNCHKNQNWFIFAIFNVFPTFMCTFCYCEPFSMSTQKKGSAHTHINVFPEVKKYGNLNYTKCNTSRELLSGVPSWNLSK
jgi:hypothetical protein